MLLRDQEQKKKEKEREPEQDQDFTIIGDYFSDDNMVIDGYFSENSGSDEGDILTVEDMLDILIDDINHNLKDAFQSFIDNAKEMENKYLYDTVVGCLEAHGWRNDLNVEKILFSLNKIKDNI